MDNETEKKLRLAKAMHRVEHIKSFLTHLASWCAINTSLFVIWVFGLVKINGPFWGITFIMTAGIGGLGVLGHGIGAFGYQFFFSKEWEAKKIEKIKQKYDQYLKQK
jgi:hypothetical protein